MNRFSHNLHFSARLGGFATPIIPVLLLLLALGAPALTEAMSSPGQVNLTPGPTDTMTPTPTMAATVTATVSSTPVLEDALTATVIVLSTETAEAFVSATAVAISAQTTSTAVAERNTQTAVAIATGTAEALRLTATVDQQNTATAVASLTAVAEKTRAYEATATALAANIIPSPTLAPSPQPSATPEPSALPVLPPAEAQGVVTPEASPEPDGGGPSMLLVVGAGVGLLAAGALGAFFVMRRMRKSVAVAPLEVTPLPPATGEGEQVHGSLLTAHRPQPGIPYLESRNRSVGVLYCPLSKPPLRVGRSTDNDLVIDDSFPGWQTVSRHHATVEYDGARVVVVPGESPNGVLVQGRRTGVNVVRDGWTVSFGQVEFMLRENRKGGAQ